MVFSSTPPGWVWTKIAIVPHRVMQLFQNLKALLMYIFRMDWNPSRFLAFIFSVPGNLDVHMLTIRVVLRITIKIDLFVPYFAYILLTYILPCNYNYRPIGHLFCVRWGAGLGIDDPRPSQNMFPRSLPHTGIFGAKSIGTRTQSHESGVKP